MRRRLTHLVILAALLAASAPATAAEEEPGEEVGPAVGSEAPGFTLEILDGGQVSLSDFRCQSPVVLVFFRGERCPRLRQTHRPSRSRLLDRRPDPAV